MEEEKKWYASKAIIGSIITIVSAILAGYFNIKVDAKTQQLLIDNLPVIIPNLVALLGGGLSLYGRVKATKTIGGNKNTTKTERT